MRGSNAERVDVDNAGLMAAIDLGSNSFQMLLAEVVGGRILEIAKFREKVQLAGGLDSGRQLQETTLRRAYQCLEKFAKEIRGLEPANIRAVGTDALRRAVNRRQFVEQAEKLLGVPVEVISGAQEAKLIYRGAAASAELPGLSSLVLDIGGGSTELAVGVGEKVGAQASLPLGCVGYSQRFFAEQKTDRQNFDRVVRLMRQTLELIPEEIRNGHWQQAIGTSGTVLAIENVLVENGWSPKGISQSGLLWLVDNICTGQPVAEIGLAGLNLDRSDIFIAGVAIMVALFQALDLKYLKTSPYSLREGLIYSMST